MSKQSDDKSQAPIIADSTRNSELNGALGAGQLQAGGALRIAVFAVEDTFRSLDNHWREKSDKQAYLTKRSELDAARMAVFDAINPVWDLVDKPQPLTKPDNRLAIFEMSETPKPHRKETLKIERRVSKSALIKALDAMPLLTRDKKVTQQQIIGFECSRCKTIYYDDIHPFEVQEMLHWRNVGGYGSIWGEGNKVEVDLCQRCTHELLEPFATIHAATTGI